MLAASALLKESREGVVELAATMGLGGGGIVDQEAIFADAVLQTVQLPARVADLHAGLPHMDRNALSLVEDGINVGKKMRIERSGERR